MIATHIRPLTNPEGGDLYRLDPPFGPDKDEYVRVECADYNRLYMVHPSNSEGRWFTYQPLAKGSTHSEALFNLAGYRIK